MSYVKQDPAQRRQVLKNLVLRRKLYEENVLRFNVRRGCTNPFAIVLIGDRPGPGAPRHENYHHTPFYSTKNCSGWLNSLLVNEKIPESRLLWLNAFDKDGSPSDPRVLFNLRPAAIIALGKNASRWLRHECGITNFFETYHPQYWKRFHARERYPLIDIIKALVN